jgi:phage tail protein X
MMAEMIMKQKVFATKPLNRQRNVVRLFLMCFLAASLITASQIANAASSAPAASTSTAESKNKSKDQQAYTAKRNMTVDELIKEVYAGTPLNNQVLVKALFEANPKVLNGKPTQSIKRGQSIDLPDHTHLVVQILTPFTPLPTTASSDAAQQGSQSSDQLSRRLWVRFP